MNAPIPAIRCRADGKPLKPCFIFGFVWDGDRALAIAADTDMGAHAPLYAEYADNFEIDLAPRMVTFPIPSERSWWQRLVNR